MALFIYEKCWRGRDDCTAVHCITSEPEGTTEEQIMNMDYVPNSFVCCGQNTDQNRVENQDRYRLCFKNCKTDEMTDNDMQDLTSILAVVSAAMNFDAIMKVNHGIVEVPAVNEGAGNSLEPGQVLHDGVKRPQIGVPDGNISMNVSEGHLTLIQDATDD